MDLRLALASLGESGVPDIPPMLENRQTAWNLIMCGDEPWRQLGAHVIDSELRSIIRPALVGAACLAAPGTRKFDRRA
jgi:hypothetical protein